MYANSSLQAIMTNLKTKISSSPLLYMKPFQQSGRNSQPPTSRWVDGWAVLWHTVAKQWHNLCQGFTVYFHWIEGWEVHEKLQHTPFKNGPRPAGIYLKKMKILFSVNIKSKPECTTETHINRTRKNKQTILKSRDFLGQLLGQQQKTPTFTFSATLQCGCCYILW